MTYRLHVMVGGSNTVAWNKFCDEWTDRCNSEGLASVAAEDRLFSIMLGDHNATDPGNNYLYIEFDTEEDATVFKLRYS